MKRRKLLVLVTMGCIIMAIATGCGSKKQVEAFTGEVISVTKTEE